MENYHSDCDINLDCDCHHLRCDQLYALNGIRNNKQKVPVGENPIGTFLVKICDVYGSCFLSHRFPQILSFYPFTSLSSHTDLTNLTDFILLLLIHVQ